MVVVFAIEQLINVLFPIQNVVHNFFLRHLIRLDILHLFLSHANRLALFASREGVLIRFLAEMITLDWQVTY